MRGALVWWNQLILRMLDDGLWDAPRWAPAFMNLLGSQFISHPPIEPYKVIVTLPDHPLVKDVDAFAQLTVVSSRDQATDVLMEAECDQPGTGLLKLMMHMARTLSYTSGMVKVPFCI